MAVKYVLTIIMEEYDEKSDEHCYRYSKHLASFKNQESADEACDFLQRIMKHINGPGRIPDYDGKEQEG